MEKTNQYGDKTVMIPLIVLNGKLQPYYGGKMPELANGSIVELVLKAHNLVHEADIQRYEVVKKVKILDQGTALRVVLKPKNRELEKDLIFPKEMTFDDPMEGIRFAEIIIKEDMYLRLRGTRKAELWPCTCKSTRDPKIKADSLNQIYTILSEKYEIWRASHTGNVFSLIHYQDSEGIWRDLETLRQQQQGKQEAELYYHSGLLPFPAG